MSSYGEENQIMPAYLTNWCLNSLLTIKLTNWCDNSLGTVQRPIIIRFTMNQEKKKYNTIQLKEQSHV